MRPDPLPVDARILGGPRPKKIRKISRETAWDGRLDLTESEAWSMTLAEFERFYSALAASGAPLDGMRKVRRQVANRESARKARARERAEAKRMREKILSLEAENAILRLILESGDRG